MPSRASACASDLESPAAISAGISGCTQESMKQGVTPALQRLSVELEEEPFQGRELGGAHLLPEAPGRGGKVSCLTAEQIGEKPTLAVLGLLDHRDEQALFRPEVVDEHAVAGAERGGQLSQRDVAYPVLGQVTERALE
jgi:hypothetical protein